MLKKSIRNLMYSFMLLNGAWADPNPYPDISPITVDGHLPFKIKISLADFELPHGNHSGSLAVYKGKWLFIGGRTNGLHGFDNGNDNFPPRQQNTHIYVVDPATKTTRSRSLFSKHAGLSQAQIDLLSVTSPQFYQEGKTLYITGGYGIDTATDTFTTKDALTAIDIPGLIDWVWDHDHHHTAAQYIRQIFDPIFQVTGGYMTRMKDYSTLLVFGQDFEGYYVPESNGTYTQVVRRFDIIDDGDTLAVKIRDSKPAEPDPNYRRRDLNVIPSIKLRDNDVEPYLVAYSGVFTVEGNAWTVPVTIDARGRPSMASPDSSHLFNQGMNNYASAAVGLFSEKHRNMYTVLLGGISLEYYENGSFQIDTELPFINQVTTIKRDKHGHFKQYLMKAEYPTILSTYSNPGNPLLFGASAYFIMADDIPHYHNGVAKLDDIKEDVLLGYIVGGIQSTLPNTNTITDSAASPYIFKVKLKRD
jgi:hypothetical protein